MADHYEALVGLDYPPMRRAEPHDKVDDLPKESIPWLLEHGLIRPVKSPKPKPKPTEGE